MTVSSPPPSPIAPTTLRQTAESEYAAELAALARLDDRERPPSWNLSLTLPLPSVRIV